MNPASSNSSIPLAFCAGEIWTTLQTAHRGQEKPLECITIPWGLSLTVAQIAEKYIPCWTFDAAKLPKMKMFVKWRGYIEEAPQLLSPPKKSLKKSLSGRYGQSGNGPGGEGKGKGGTTEQLPTMAFFEALLKAKKGEARPKSLWSTVNLI